MIERVTIQEAERIVIEANADPDGGMVRAVEEDRRVAEALDLMWRTHLGRSPLYYPPFHLVAAVEAQTGKPVWSWSEKVTERVTTACDASPE